VQTLTNAELKKRTVRNISFNAVAKALMFGLQAVANIILTRTLGAGDYGLVGLAIIFMNFFTLFGDMGITNAVIRKGNLTDRDVQTGFTVRVAQGVFLALIGIAAAPLASMVFHDPEVGRILAVFSLNFIINSFGFIPFTYLNRELRYDRLFIPQVGYALTGSLVAITLALAGFRHWSLVFSTISSSVAYVILLNIMRPSRLSFSFDVKVAKHFFSYGMNIFLIGFVSYALLNAGNFSIGAVLGPNALGYYTIAATWGGMICTIITGVVSSVLFPTFAKIQDDRDRLRNAYLRIFELIGTIAIFANLALLSVSQDFLYVVLGHNSDKWFPSLMALQILCGLGIVKSIMEPGANLLMAVGNTAVPFKATLAAAIVQLSLIYPALRFGGIEGVAALILFSTSVQFAVYLPALRLFLGVRVRDVLAQMRPAVFAMLFTGISFYFCAPLWGPVSLVTLLAKAAVLLALFGTCYGFLTRWRVIHEIKGYLKGRVAVTPLHAKEI